MDAQQKTLRPFTRPVRFAVLLLALMALPLSACGKKGDLQPPPSHADPAGEDEGGEGGDG